MRLPFFIARRYYFSKNNPSAINIITGISIFGYLVGSFALLVLMSALNGFEKTIFTVYETYYPDIKIKPANGKTLKLDSVQWKKLQKTEGVEAAEPVLEENAILSNNDQQVVALVKGITPAYSKVINMDRLVVDGKKNLETKDNGFSDCLMAGGLIQKLNIHTNDYVVHALTPRRETFGVAQLETSETDFSSVGIIDPGDELSQKLCMIDYNAACRLFEREGFLSNYEVKIKEGADIGQVKDKIKQLFGSSAKVLERKEQNEAVYKMFVTEKWVAFGLMAFILLIISFNLVGSLSLLVLEKKKDIRLMLNLGMSRRGIKNIFFNQGVLIALSGTIMGLGLGVLAVWLQQKYGFIKTNAMFAIEYPVALRVGDVLLILLLSTLLGLASTIYPALKAAENTETQNAG